MFAFCGRPLKRIFNMQLIGFQLRTTKRELKFALKRQRYYVSRNPSQCALQATIHCCRSRSSSNLWWYSRMTEGRTRRLIHGLLTKTQFCLSFTTPWSSYGSFPAPQSCLFINRPLFRSSPMVMKLNWVMTERVISRVQVAEMGFLRRVHSMTLRDKESCCEIRKSLNVEPLLIRIERSQLWWVGHVFRMLKENRRG